MDESIGDAWWPSTWRCPSAFALVLYFVAPPSRLQPGQFDLMREVKEGPQGNAFEQAGMPLMEAKPVDTSDANPGLSAEEIAMQARQKDVKRGAFPGVRFNIWTNSSTTSSPELVSEVSERFGEVRPSGRLFVGVPQAACEGALC